MAGNQYSLSSIGKDRNPVAGRPSNAKAGQCQFQGISWNATNDNLPELLS
jgi:hypothetical protein